jgi:hypothetical protein
LTLDAAAVLCLALTLVRWFGGVPSWLPAWAPLLAFAACLVAPRWRAWRAGTRPPRPHVETLVCLALAVLYRASALAHPWGWVNRDGAYGAFVALHLLAGERPAPVFTEGANYQGTLKGHLAALLSLATRDQDFSRLIAVAGLLLTLAFVAASMALARRIGGTAAAWITGLYLAVGPRFPTVLLLNSVGQYADVLALGGAALALLARLLQDDRGGREARALYFAIGLLLGAAFWQQPVALAYALAAAAALALRRRTWRDPWTLAAPLGMAVGALPVLLWNLQNGWASGDILGRDPSDVMAQAEALAGSVAHTFTVSFPILCGLSPGHPWASLTVVRLLAVLVAPAAFLGALIACGRGIVGSLRERSPSPAVLPLLLALASLALFWSVAAGRVHWRPRYLLPAFAAAAVYGGVALAGLARRSRVAAAAVLGALLAFNAAGFWPRTREARQAEEYYRALVRSLDEKGIRTGYADFALAAPVTMFTAERILISPRLGPTPAYYSPSQESRVAARGPDAFLIRPRDDPDGFARALTSLGVGFAVDRDPVPVFHALSRRVTIEEVLAAWGKPAAAGEGAPE